MTAIKGDRVFADYCMTWEDDMDDQARVLIAVTISVAAVIGMLVLAVL